MVLAGKAYFWRVEAAEKCTNFCVLCLFTEIFWSEDKVIFIMYGISPICFHLNHWEMKNAIQSSEDHLLTNPKAKNNLCHGVDLVFLTLFRIG
jgi:hypothetical protein